MGILRIFTTAERDHRIHNLIAPEKLTLHDAADPARFVHGAAAGRGSGFSIQFFGVLTVCRL